MLLNSFNDYLIFLEFNISDERLGWIVGALTAATLLLMIIIVVLVVCKARLFVKKSSQVLETVSVSEKTRRSHLATKRYSESPGKTFEQENQNATNIASVLPNRSPQYEHVRKNRNSSKVYDNIRIHKQN